MLIGLFVWLISMVLGVLLLMGKRDTINKKLELGYYGLFTFFTFVGFLCAAANTLGAGPVKAAAAFQFFNIALLGMSTWYTYKCVLAARPAGGPAHPRAGSRDADRVPRPARRAQQGVPGGEAGGVQRHPRPGQPEHGESGGRVHVPADVRVRGIGTSGPRRARPRFVSPRGTAFQMISLQYM